jgi:hypothetical protein
MPKEAKIYKTLEDYLKEGYFKHSTISNYVANKCGDIVNVSTNKIVQGSVNKCGYMMITIGKYQFHKHRLIYEAVHGELIDPNVYDISHIDLDKFNNNISNLKKTSKEEEYETKISKSLENYLKEGWYKHPTKSSHIANKFGEVICVSTNKIILGTINKSGYYVISINEKQIVKHKFIYEAMYGKLVDSKVHDIDHIDTNKLNNNMSNLQKLTKNSQRNKKE